MDLAIEDWMTKSSRPVAIEVRHLTIRLYQQPSVWASAFSSVWKKRWPAKKVKPKPILHNVSVYAPAGTITAILGPSGSGKTSLLNALAGRSSHGKSRLTGQILCDGHLNISLTRSVYLPQKDVLQPRLTVRETLRYAAGLRMQFPNSVEERDSAVQRIIDSLDLTTCADTRIGNGEANCGCSGGEKRRTSIGVQLLADPSVLFLDEPTSGLDAHNALSLMHLLKRLADRGRTIILTVHQPRSEMWKLFDHMVLLNGGKALYSGSREECISYFEHLGHQLPDTADPAEYLIDIASGADKYLDKRSAPNASSTKPFATAKVEVEADQSGEDDFNSFHGGSIKGHQKLQSSFWRRTIVQARRSLVLSWRDPMQATAAWFECIIFGILTGWIFFKLDGTQSGIRSREGAFYTIAAMQTYVVLVFETYRLTVDIQVFDRERVDGVVDAASFLLGRRVAKLLTEDIVVPLIYAITTYFMIGFRHNSEQFGIFFVTVLLGQLLAVNTAAICVAIFRDFARASLSANLIFTINSICSGIYISSNQIPVYVRWLKYLAFIWYANGALITNEFMGTTRNITGYLYDCPFGGNGLDPECLHWTGRFVVASLGYPLARWILIPLLILMAFLVLYIFISWLVLQFHAVDIVTSARGAFDDEEESSTVTASKRYQSHDVMAKRSSSLQQGLSIRLIDCSLTVEQRTLPAMKSSTRKIFSSLNATFRPGALNVIMGVSGSGKTSLLRLMAGRLHNTLITCYRPDGLIELEAQTFSDNAPPACISFLSQDDNDGLIPSLTVRETLHFGARLRLPKSMSKRSKIERAEEIIKKLKLEDCASVLVGNTRIKGISGGERRRVSIARQLLSEHNVLILDEPTSGLDARMASKLIAMLHDLALDHYTVIVALHQPSSIDFKYFDEILLLTKSGRPAYTGPGKDMLRSFELLGHKCPPSSNPSDFVLDITGADWKYGVDVAALNHKVEQKCTNCTDSVMKLQAFVMPRGTAIYSSYLQSVPLLLQRGFTSMRRSSSIFVVRIAHAIGFIALLVLFFSPLRRDYEGIQAYAGFLQQLTGFYFVGMLQNIAVYPIEQDVFERDHEDNMYGAEAFLTAYSMLEIPFEFLTSSITAMLATLIVGLPRRPEVFGVITFCIFALINVGESVGIMFCALFRSTGFAVSVTTLVLAAGLLMSGILSTDLRPVLKELNYLSPGKWSIGAMAPYTLQGVTFTCSAAQKDSNGRCPVSTDMDVLNLYNLPEEGSSSLLYLALVVVAYRLLAYCFVKLTRSRWRVQLWNRSRRRAMDIV